ncbi:MAG TPA: molybdopterin cofactor-binding domain-containing protein, partial [Candidatus Limnocylindria bacterium]|nr:molybdopterin cofactor-binding domain-containing protein [Candidatus Limnocylindria bacterium]
ASAHRVFEGTYEAARTYQAYIEPRAAIVWIEGDVVHAISTNKAPFNLRDHLAAALGLDKAKVVVDTPHVGGDFGGKGLSVDEFALYFLAKATGRPVRSVMRYADDLQATNTRAAARVRLRTAVDRDGRILAHEARVLYDGGAYAGGKPVATGLPGDALFTLVGYRVPAARVEAIAAYTNAVPSGHARAPGQPQNAFAVEQHLDEIAEALGLDPLELRLRNAPADGDPDVEGEPFSEPTTRSVLERLRAEAPPRPGRGYAVGGRHGGRGKTSLVLTQEADGGVEILTGVTDQGGGAHTMLARVVAEELGVDPARVRVRRGTTAEAPEDPGVGGSRVTAVAGGAALDAARKLRERLAAGERPPLRVVGEHTAGGHALAVYAYAVDATVDRETGQVRLTGATLVADVGTVINPVALRGQLEGGFAFGLGQAVMEELRVEGGRVVTANLGDYKIPTAADVPPLRVILLTEAKGSGPFGAKSVGELSNPAVGPAVANAVASACGARVRSLPVTAEKVHRTLAGR